MLSSAFGSGHGHDRIVRSGQEQTFGSIPTLLSKGGSLYANALGVYLQICKSYCRFPRIVDHGWNTRAVEPFQVLPSSVSPIDLGEAVHCALEDSRENIPQPTDWQAFAVPRLAAAGVKTEAAFQKKSQLVSAEFNGTVLKITPNRNGGAAGAKKGLRPRLSMRQL